MKHVAEHKASSYALIDAMVEHMKAKGTFTYTVADLLDAAGINEDDAEESIEDLTNRFFFNGDSGAAEFLLIVSHFGNVHDCLVPLKSALLLEKYLLSVYQACKKESDKSWLLAEA